MIPFARPTTLDQAVGLLSSQPWCVLAGGTDVYPAHVDKPLTEPILDISGLSDLRSIAYEDGAWRIGGLATWTDIVNAELPPAFDGLKLAAREVGSVQIQNVATIAGNLCNASPAADGVPPLLTLDAEIELTSAVGKRVLPLSDFITGYRATARRDDELVTAVLIPDAGAAGTGVFQKFGARKYLVISIVMAAVRLQARRGQVTEARVALGACTPVAVRLFELEEALIGRGLNEAAATVSLQHVRKLAPIDDVRATADYRREAALELVRRAIAKAALVFS